MPIIRLCKLCGVKMTAYLTTDNKCFPCKRKAYKPISKKGRESLLYDKWRDTVAKPYLDKRYSHVCAVKGCQVTEGLEVDHIKTRGSRHDLKFDVKNVQYLCFYHHRLKTDGKL